MLLNAEDVIWEIFKVAPNDPSWNDKLGILGYVVEEVGEISQCLTTEHGYKNKKIKEPTKVECVDAIITLLHLFFASGGHPEEFASLAESKIQKWKERLTKNASL